MEAKKSAPCGSCDNCLRQKKKGLSREEFNNLHQQITQLLAEKSLPTNELLLALRHHPEEQLWEALDYLQVEHQITVSPQGIISLLR